MIPDKRRLHLVFWGTYDTGKPRVRILLSALKSAPESYAVSECHGDLWRGIEDKSRLDTFNNIFYIIKMMLYYPILIGKYCLLPKHDAVIVSYPGHMDVLLLYLCAKTRKTPIVWDVFMSAYDTVVNDRKLFSPRSPFSAFIYCIEWLACRAASKLFMDTHAHARYLEQLYHLKKNSVQRIFVGVETKIFKRQRQQSDAVKKESVSVLFYGQFIPLHGIDVIIKAAQLARQKQVPVRWTIIGKGQVEKRIDALIKAADITTILRVPWVGYEDLSQYIHSADICLGIFGTSEKALRVIPNKVFQICAVGKPLITADTPAIRELLSPGQMIRLIPPGDPAALFEAVCSLLQQSFSEAMVTRECPIIDNKVILNQCDALFDK